MGNPGSSASINIASVGVNTVSFPQPDQRHRSSLCPGVPLTVKPWHLVQHLQVTTEPATIKLSDYAVTFPANYPVQIRSQQVEEQ